MMPAAKMLDPILGVDVHMIQPPGPVPPVPVPHPHTGILFDPFDLAPYIGSTVSVGGLPRAVAGTGSKMIPDHIPIGGVFIKPPANDSELLLGSSTVTADGDPFSYLALPLLSCWDVGGPPIPRPPRSLLPSLVLPTTVVLSVPSGVTVGGAPTVSLTALAGRVGLGPLMALYQFATTGNPMALIGLAGPALKGLKFLNKKLNVVKKSKCGKGVKLFGGKMTIGGEPINLVTGAQFLDADDMVEPEGLFHFRRHYSTAKRDQLGPLGYGFTHAYEQRLELYPQCWRYLDNEDVEVDFEPLSATRPESRSGGMTLRLVDGRTAELERRNAPTLRFSLPADRRKGVARLGGLRSGDRTLELQYDAQRLVTLVERDRSWAPGQQIVFSLEYDAAGLLVALWRRDDEGSECVARYAYDTHRGLLIGSLDAEKRTTGYEYDARRLMTRREDPGGYQFVWAYDAQGRCIETRGHDGLWDCRVEYFPGQRETHIWQDGERFVLRYDVNQRITERVTPDGGVQTWEIDDAGRIVGEVDAGGREMRWRYKADGVHHQRVDRFGNVYPPEWEEPFTADPMAPTWPQTPLEREAGMRPSDEAALGADPHLVGRLPVQAQRIARQLIPLRSPGQPVPAEVDSMDRLGRVVQRRDPAGRVHRWAYEHSSHPTSHWDADGRRHEQRTDRWNLVTAQIDPLGHTTQYAYTPREEVACITDALGNETHYEYDAQDRLTRIRRHGGVEEQFVYDAHDRLVERRDGQGNTLVELEYDHRCLLETRVLTEGGTHTLEHDAFGNPTVVATDEHDVRIDRDRRGRILADRVDGQGVEHSGGGGWRTTTVLGRYTIELRDRSTAWGSGAVLIDPTGGRHMLWRDDAGLVLREHPRGCCELSHYDDQGRCLTRVSSKTADDGKEVAQSIRYQRSAEGDLLMVDDSVRGVTHYEVDEAHRLVGESGPGGRHVYVHDAAGNLLEKPGLSGVALREDNQLHTANGETLAYDSRFHLARRVRGEREVRYHYDSLDMLVRVEDEHGVPWTAAYDGWGRRLRCGRGEAQTRFYWDGERLAAEVSPEGRLRIYVYPNASAWQPVLFVDYDRVGEAPERGRVYAVFYDQSGQPLRIEDAAGQVVWWAERVDPYGTIEVADGAGVDFALRWPGHYFDADTGLHYNRYRYYDPVLGRYLQTDPMGQAGGLNVYAYPSNPLRDVDVLGLAKHTGKGAGTSGSKGPKKGAKNPSATTAPKGKSGKPYDPKTGKFVKDPNAKGPSKVSHHSKTDPHPQSGNHKLAGNQKVTVKSKGGKTTKKTAKQAADDRKAALDEAAKHPKGSKKHKEKQQEARENSEALGEAATDKFVKESYAPKKATEIGGGGGANKFDKVYELDPPPPKYVIAESKGGSGSNSSSRQGPGDSRYEQGTPEYKKQLLEDMAENGTPAQQKAAREMLNDPDSHDYTKVSQPYDKDGGLEPIKADNYHDKSYPPDQR